MNKGFQLTSAQISENSYIVARKKPAVDRTVARKEPVINYRRVPIKQLSLSTQETICHQLRIVTQFRIDKARLYVIALPPLDKVVLNDTEDDTENGIEQVQRWEQLIGQFFSLEETENGQLSSKVSVIDSFEIASERYCVVQINPVQIAPVQDIPLPSRSLKAPMDVALTETTVSTEHSDCAQVALQELLSPREQEIICLIALGLSNKQISVRLNISIWTVSAHLRRIFTKLKVDTRAAVVYQCSRLIQGWQKCMG